MKNPKNIAEEIEAIRNNSNARKFTLVLGSGFHKAAIGSGYCLSNWDLLLLKLGLKSCSSKNYILQFEELILVEAILNGNKAAADIENKLLSRTQEILKEEVESVDLAKYESLKFLFDSNLVSDVISLNYDAVAEEICSKELKHNGGITWENQNSCVDEHKPKSTARIKLTTDYRQIGSKRDKSIRFWYPHGSLLIKNSIVLGVNSYTQLLVSFDRVRKHYKRKEREYFTNHGKNKPPDWDSIDLSWYTQLLNNPVIFLGTSLSDVEWDLWTAITHANRNFAKSKKHKHNMYIMLDKYEHCHPNSSWLKPLFAGMSYEEQWSKLQDYFNK